MIRNSQAFTMIELVIVLFVSSLLFMGGIQVTQYYLEQSNIKATNIKLNAIQRALEIYVQQNGKLPCPAGLKTSTGSSLSTCTSTDTTNGILVTSGIVRGGVPYKDLDLTPDVSHDSWKGKIIYSVNISSTTDIRKMDNDTYFGIYIYNNTTSYTITSRAIYSLASNGKNKFGAYNYDTNTIISSTGISTYEARNMSSALANTNVYFTNLKTTDDMVRYKTRIQLLNEAGLEDLNCYVTSTIITALLSANNITDSPSFSVPSGNYIGYNEEIKSSNLKYKIKCYKYGRLGVFKYAQ